jgi:hypothetical protein
MMVSEGVPVKDTIIFLYFFSISVDTKRADGRTSYPGHCFSLNIASREQNLEAGAKG